MTHKEIAKRMTKVELLEHVENLLEKIDGLLAERDQLREALIDLVALSSLPHDSYEIQRAAKAIYGPSRPDTWPDKTALQEAIE